jgi:hypothetical protein
MRQLWIPGCPLSSSQPERLSRMKSCRLGSQTALSVTFFTSSFFFSFFLGSTTFHSPPRRSFGSDGNWVALLVRAEATECCLARASRPCRLPPKRSSMALMMEGPSSSTFFSRAERRALSFCPFLGGHPDSEAEAPRREHSWGALTATLASSFRRTSFSSSNNDGFASVSLGAWVTQAGPILLNNCIVPVAREVAGS